MMEREILNNYISDSGTRYKNTLMTQDIPVNTFQQVASIHKFRKSNDLPATMAAFFVFLEKQASWTNPPAALGTLL